MHTTNFIIAYYFFGVSFALLSYTVATYKNNRLIFAGEYLVAAACAATIFFGPFAFMATLTFAVMRYKQYMVEVKANKYDEKLSTLFITKPL